MGWYLILHLIIQRYLSSNNKEPLYLFSQKILSFLILVILVLGLRQGYSTLRDMEGSLYNKTLWCLWCYNSRSRYCCYTWNQQGWSACSGSSRFHTFIFFKVQPSIIDFLRGQKFSYVLMVTVEMLVLCFSFMFTSDYCWESPQISFQEYFVRLRNSSRESKIL